MIYAYSCVEVSQDVEGVSLRYAADGAPQIIVELIFCIAGGT